MGIGLRRGTVAVEEHNPEWEKAAEQTIDRLKEILQDAAAEIQHVGSTAIKNICAKPIIDLAVGTDDPNEILKRNDILEANGFIFRGQDYPDQYLYVCGEDDFRTHHIHVVKYHSEAWEHYLDLRDYLNCHEEDARAYSELKKTLAKLYPQDRAMYTAMKSELIHEILNKAYHWRKDIAAAKTSNWF